MNACPLISAIKLHVVQVFYVFLIHKSHLMRDFGFLMR